MSKKKYEVNLDSIIASNSKLPIEILIRMELNRQGMKFVDDGSAFACCNRNPVPLGKCVRWDEPQHPFMIYFTQELTDEQEAGGK